MSDDIGSRPIARWRIIASLALVAQIAILIALKAALEEGSWFVGSLSTTVDEGPLMLEGVAANVSIDMKSEQDDVRVEFFGYLRLTHWQDERDERATLSVEEAGDYEENLDETFSSPTPSTVKSTTMTLLHVGIGFSFLLLILIGIDLKKQSSGGLLTTFRRCVSLASVLNILAVLLLILLILPASWFGTVVGNPQDFSNAQENEAFLAHAQFSEETSIGLDGFVLEFEVSGYDIGMIRPATRSAVDAEPPLPGSPDADSFISMRGDMRTETPEYISEFVFYWIFLWVILPFALLIQQRVAIDSRLRPLHVHE